MAVAVSIGPWQIVLVALVVIFLLGILPLWLIVKALSNKRKD